MPVKLSARERCPHPASLTVDAEMPEAMGYDENAAERVRRILSGRLDVIEKRMVGGLSFIVNGSMCCGLTSTALMVRVGPEAYERALAQPHVRPMEFAGRPLAAFVCVDPAGYRTDTALATWVQRGIDFVMTLPEKQPASKRRRSKAPRK
jgi:TfoX/Sxy family transcriptional regulator of competence genes